jgi:hypothetical protein
MHSLRGVDRLLLVHSCSVNTLVNTPLDLDRRKDGGGGTSFPDRPPSCAGTLLRRMFGQDDVSCTWGNDMTRIRTLDERDRARVLGHYSFWLDPSNANEAMPDDIAWLMIDANEEMEINEGNGINREGTRREVAWSFILDPGRDNLAHPS